MNFSRSSSAAHRHHPADAGAGAGGVGALFPAAGGAAAQYRHSRPSSVSANMAGRQPGNDVDQRGDAAGASSGHDRRRHRDDLAQLGRLHPGRAAIRHQPRHRRRGARRAGGDQRGARRSAGGAALQSDLPQVQSGRFPDHDPGADVQDADAGADLRPGLQHPAAEAVADRGRRRCLADTAPSLPAVRIELNPRALFKYGIGLEDVRAAICPPPMPTAPRAPSSRARSASRSMPTTTRSQATEYQTLIVAYRNNAAVRLSDVADVSDGVENVRNLGMSTASRRCWCTITKQPGANVIEVVDTIQRDDAAAAAGAAAGHRSRHRHSTPPPRSAIRCMMSRSTLMLSTILVMLVVFLFLRNFRATLVPSVSVPLSLLGTFGVMYLLGFSLDNFSLMALDRFDRLRGRQHHRRAGERHAPSGEGRRPHAGGAAGRAAKSASPSCP